MHLTQGTFSFLPPFSDEEIAAQVQYGIDRGWVVSIEYTDDPHPRNVYWEMWGLPMFDVDDAAGVMAEIRDCRRVYPDHYVKVNAYDRSKVRQTTAFSFIVHRPDPEPTLRLDRLESADRSIRYSFHVQR